MISVNQKQSPFTNETRNSYMNQSFRKNPIKRFLNALYPSMALRSDGNEFQRQMADLVKDLGGKQQFANEKFWHDCLIP